MGLPFKSEGLLSLLIAIINLVLVIWLRMSKKDYKFLIYAMLGLVLTFVSITTYSAGWKLYHAVLGSGNGAAVMALRKIEDWSIRTCNTGIDGTDPCFISDGYI